MPPHGCAARLARLARGSTRSACCIPPRPTRASPFVASLSATSRCSCSPSPPFRARPQVSDPQLAAVEQNPRAPRSAPLRERAESAVSGGHERRCGERLRLAGRTATTSYLEVGTTVRTLVRTEEGEVKGAGRRGTERKGDRQRAGPRPRAGDVEKLLSSAAHSRAAMSRATSTNSKSYYPVLTYGPSYDSNRSGPPPSLPPRDFRRLLVASCRRRPQTRQPALASQPIVRSPLLRSFAGAFSVSCSGGGATSGHSSYHEVCGQPRALFPTADTHYFHFTSL